jgi:hypothetical protein
VACHGVGGGNGWGRGKVPGRLASFALSSHCRIDWHERRLAHVWPVWAAAWRAYAVLVALVSLIAFVVLGMEARENSRLWALSVDCRKYPFTLTVRARKKNHRIGDEPIGDLRP